MSEPDIALLDPEARANIRDLVRSAAASLEEVAAQIFEADLPLDREDVEALERAVQDARAAVAVADAEDRRELH
jgi:NAD(P)H-dependent FMN reductase